MSDHEIPLRHEVLEREIFNADTHGPWSQSKIRVEIKPGQWDIVLVDDAIMRLGDQHAADYVRGRVRKNGGEVK